MYLGIRYRSSEINKSLGVIIPFDSWDNKSHKIIDGGYCQRNVDDKLAESKEKLMGAYYMLSQNTAEPTLREIVDMAFGENDRKSHSLFGVNTFGS